MMDRQWVAVQCEASEALPAVAEDTCIWYESSNEPYHIIDQCSHAQKQ